MNWIIKTALKVICWCCAGFCAWGVCNWVKLVDMVDSAFAETEEDTTD